MILNKKQKQFLFANNYVNSKVLDAITCNGWQDSFIKNYVWELKGKDQWGFDRLLLVNNGKSAFGKKGNVEYEIGLNFQNNDYKLLLATK